jgi:alkaline phosphatase D
VPTADLEPPFVNGVASFDPTANSVVLWTRVPGVARVRWSVAPADGGEPVAGGEAEVPAKGDHCVAVTVDGLDPTTSYRYWFEAGPSHSPVGRTRTLPAEGTAPVRIGVACCADWSRGHFTAYRALADADVDLVLHVGDYIYETQGKGNVRDPEPDREVVSLDDYRARYAQCRSDADLVALHQRHPMVTMWDDHDIADNAYRDGAKHHDPNEHGAWPERLRAAATARQEWLPARLRDPSDPLTLYRSFAIGDLAELVLLDTRIVGRDVQPDDDGTLPYDDPRRSMLGDEQRAWAHERIRDTTRPWCLLLTAVVLNHMELPVERGEKLGDLAPSGYAVIGGKAMCTDEWDGYPAERERLLAAIAERGAGVVAVSGDVHSAWAFEGPCPARDSADPAGPAAPVAVEFVAPCVTATPMARQLPPGWRKLLPIVAERLPEARWFELEHHGFMVLEVDTVQVRCHWYAVDAEDPEASVEHCASWAHRREHPGRLEPVDLGDATDEPLRPRSGLQATGPQVVVPARPAPVLNGEERRRRRRGRLGVGAVVTAAAAAVGAAVRHRHRG